MILILMGKTASGKDSIAKELCRNYQFARIITYTTRPPRKGETDGVDYHFILKAEFQQQIKHNFFAEWKSYQTVDGEWLYGTAAEDLQKNGLLILTPQGIRDLHKVSRCVTRVVYVTASDETIMKRLVARGDNPTEAVRRLNHDREDFNDNTIKELTDFQVRNEDRSISDIAKEIMNYWNVEEKKLYEC